jgi:hypothetical protein
VKTEYMLVFKHSLDKDKDVDDDICNQLGAGFGGQFRMMSYSGEWK